MTSNEEQQQQEQVEQRDKLVRAAMFAVGSAVTGNERAVALAQAPRANQDHYAVASAIGYLLGEGLITCAPPEAFEQWLPVDIAEHLKPDVAGYLPTWLS